MKSKQKIKKHLNMLKNFLLIKHYFFEKKHILYYTKINI